MFAAFSPHAGSRITIATPLASFELAMELVGAPSINPVWWVGQAVGCRVLVTAAGAAGFAEPTTGSHTVALVELRRHLRLGLRLRVDDAARPPRLDGSASVEPDFTRALFTSAEGAPSVASRFQDLVRGGWAIEVTDTCIVARTELCISAPAVVEELVVTLARLANEIADRRDALGHSARDRARTEVLLRAGAPLDLRAVSPDGVLSGEVKGLAVSCTYDDLGAQCTEVRVGLPAARLIPFRIAPATGLVPGFLADDVAVGDAELDRKLDIRCGDRAFLGELVTPELKAALLRLRDRTHGFVVTERGVAIRAPRVAEAGPLAALLAAAVDVALQLGAREGSAYR